MHILASGPMCSLRRALLAWLVPLFLLVGAAAAAVAYWSYTTMVDQFMDEQMQLLAEAIAHNDEPPPARMQDGEALHRHGSFVRQVWTAAGQLESTTSPGLDLALAGTAGFHDLTAAGSRWRAYASEPGTQGRRVQVLQSGEFRRKLAVGRAGAAVAPILILLPLAIGILWLVVAKLSREVQEIGRKAAQQDEHSIAELPLTRVPGEIVPLVASFNLLLTRLREAFVNQRRFLQDAAHELRTPITAVALQLENVRRELPAGFCAGSFAQLEAGVGRAQRLVDQLLKLAREENAGSPEPSVQVDLQAQVHQCISGLIALADQRGIDLGFVAVPGAPASAALRCQAADLRSALDNLVENALRYTPTGGVVDVRLSAREDGRPVIEVVDTGPGIPPEQLERVFDRFFRVPGSAAAGTGLGLSIARSAAGRCGLRIVLRNRQDRSGLVARLEPAEPG